MGEYFKDITLHKYFQKEGNLPPEKMEMFFMVCYDLDKFRKFIFESSFFDKFEVDDDTVSKIKDDDVELLKFGYNWLKFALFGEKTIAVKTDVLEATKKAIEKRSKSKPKTG